MDGNDAPQSLLGTNVPRYTSYPTANHFTSGGGRALREPFLNAIRTADAVSVYIHIPYCDRMCWFCGCHTKQTLNYAPVRQYIRTLRSEIALLQQALGNKPVLARLHLGGGSPSLLQAAELMDLRDSLAQSFAFTSKTEVSIELDPSDMSAVRLDGLIEFGLTRASIGVQDFDPVVQRAINRPQGFELTRDVVESLRARNVASINIDMLYGLPFQTPDRLADTVAKVLSLKPQRIALFGYAHVPWMKPHQKLIPEAALPQADQRFVDAQTTAATLVAAGYQNIGIDHFALPRDSLAVAARNGSLRRNFQGYVEDDCDVLIGLGASSISQFAGGYLQNDVASGRYAAAIARGEFAHDRGVSISDNDRARGWMIERVMCNFGFSKPELDRALPHQATDCWDVAQKIAHGKLSRWLLSAPDTFTLTPEARPFARSIAAAFDEYFKPETARHSAAV